MPGVTAVQADGHTPGHTAFLVASGKDQLMYVADITNNPAIFAKNPELKAMFDMDADRAVATRKAILDRAAADKVRVDTPTQNLETYFLDVVQKARQAAAETSGATSGARVAAYLRGEAEPAPTPDRILERLTAPPPKPVEAAPPAPAPAETAAQAKLEALTRPEPPAPAPAPAPAAEPARQAELEKANEKLAALLGKPRS